MSSPPPAATLPPPSDDDVVPDPLVQDNPISVPESSDGSEGGKLKMIVQLVKRCLGVKDIAAMYVRDVIRITRYVHRFDSWVTTGVFRSPHRS